MTNLIIEDDNFTVNPIRSTRGGLLDQGFILMEDPFLPSDEERLGEQLKILSSFVDEGWQVIMFTAKENVKEELLNSGGTLIKELERI